MAYQSEPSESSKLPKGIPYIVANEAAERFSFYGMKAALPLFIANYLHLMGATVTDSVSDVAASEQVHLFVTAVYFTPLLGALLSDRWLGKYSTIIKLSLVYCLGHACLALMGIAGPASLWLLSGLGLIALGAGGIKPCVSAHVGDQFGPNNQHLLTRIFNWFYFSINLGAALSNIAIPWLLEWHGPHWAFGIPGVLMALATLLFWMGRHTFIHIPPAGKTFTQELFSKDGLRTVAKLTSIFLFIPVFWALFDQTASSWVFQAEDMNRDLFGIHILSAQVQAANPFLILVLIPIFTYVIYPTVEKFVPLNPLRKIGAGLFLIALTFALTAWIQERIDAGETPSIAWQLFAYVMLTSAEIMVSIVCLEFAYTQAPKSMKSMVMSLFLLTVAAGNFITAGINRVIQTPSPTSQELALYQKAQKDDPTLTALVFAGHDGKKGTADDIIVNYAENGTVKSRTVPAKASLEKAASLIQQWVVSNDHHLPQNEKGSELISSLVDDWGHTLNYRLLNRNTCRITSHGPDQKAVSQWDTGVIISLDRSSLNSEVTKSEKPKKQTWLDKRKAELGVDENSSNETNPHKPFRREFIAGGQTKLEGASYFWFFAGLMLVTSLIYIPIAKRFKLVD